MKSLYLSEEYSVSVGEFLISEEKIVTSCLNEFDNELYIATSNNRVLCVSCCDRKVSDLRISKQASANSDRMFSLEYVTEGQFLCIAFFMGDIIIYSKIDHTTSCVGSVEGGLRCMSWSPDQSVVLFLTGNGTLIEMTRDWDIIFEFSITASQSETRSPVSLGWGKAETQFRGKEGKLLLQKENQVEMKLLSSDDDFSSHISWHGNGQSFSLNTIDTLHVTHTPRFSESSCRTIRIYSREGVFCSKTEPISQLEQIVSWKPSGSLIASTQRQQNRRDVVFFEPVGLRHGEFSLRESLSSRVRDIQWSIDSNILFVLIEREHEDVIQLWTVNNYHWYLKQERCFAKHRVCTFHPHNENPLTLTVILVDSIEKYTFSWNTITLSSRDDDGHVAVIDGSQLLLSALGRANIPPPMSQRQLKTDHNIIDVRLHEYYCAILTTHELILYNAENRKICQYTAIRSLKLDVDRTRMRQVAFLGRNHLVTLSYNAELGSDALHLICRETFEVSSSMNLSVNVMKLVACSLDVEECLMVAVDGSVYVISINPFISKLLLKLPSPTTDIRTVYIGSQNQMGILSLSDTRRLYFNRELICSDVTSCFTDSSIMMYTTLSHDLRIVDLVDMSEGQIAEQTRLFLEMNSESSRKVERGSCIIRSHGVSVVLQMPRGNLETIYPRMLVLQVVRRLLNEKRYKEAFVLVRTHRVDMNFLVDHCPETFVDDIGIFIDSVKEPDYLNLFLTSLRNEDVTLSIYRVSKKSESKKNPTSSFDVKNKVNILCDCVRKELESRDVKYYMQTLLTTFARKQPAEIEEALRHVQKQEKGLLEGALAYLVFLIDVNELYQVSLGMYDLSLALMVAQQAQNDPKEYLAFINDIQLLKNDHMKRFKIDDKLKRYPKALLSLTLSDEPFATVLQYTVQHKLYKEALSCYKERPDLYKLVMGSYGDHLSTIAQHEDAGLAYSTANRLSDALASYQRANKWRLSLTIARQLNYSTAEMNRFCRVMYQQLMDAGRYDAAAIVAMDYLSSVEDAFMALIRGSSYDEAMRLASCHSRLDLIQTILVNELNQHADSLLEQAQDVVDRMNEQFRRLLIVRSNKQAVVLEADEDTVGNIDISSEATTAVQTLTSSWQGKSAANSFATGRTGHRGKNKKKQEKKMFRGKEGGAFEEEYLIDALGRKMSWINDKKKETKSVISTLLTCHEISKAHRLKEIFQLCFDFSHEHFNVIFDGIGSLAAPIEKPVMVPEELWYPSFM